MKTLRVKLDWLISPLVYVFKAIFFPLLISELTYNVSIYKKCAEFIRNKIKYNEDFKKFLDSHLFYEAWFGRLYTHQSIPEKLSDNLTDEDLQEIALKNIAEKHDFIINQGFIEILIMRTKRINRNNYVLILEIANFNSIKSIIIHLVFSLILWMLILRIVYVFYFDQILNFLKPVQDFIIHIL